MSDDYAFITSQIDAQNDESRSRTRTRSQI